MTLDTILDAPFKNSANLVQVVWGDESLPNVWRFTDANADITAGPGTFSALPSTEIKPAPYTPLFERVSWKINLPVEPLTGAPANLVAALGRQEAHPVVDITIYSWLFDNTDPSTGRLLIRFDGRAAFFHKNPDDKQGLVQFEVLSGKSDVRRAMGVQCNPQCGFTFGDVKTCDAGGVINLPSKIQAGRITAVNGFNVTITNLTVPRDRYFHRGWVSKDGIRIRVHEYISGTAFVLGERVPLEWRESLLVAPFYVDVSVTPGCDKKEPTCKEWANERENQILGIAIPAYHPQFESPV